MTDYFDALEEELKTAVPRAARSHRRGRGIAHFPLFRLSTFLLLIALGLAPALILTHGAPHHGTRARPASRQSRHHRPAREPNDMTLLKGLVALRRRADVPSVEAHTLDRRTRLIVSAPVTSLLRFVAGTAAVGVQSALISSRRRINDPYAAARDGNLRLVVPDPHRCGSRQHLQSTSGTRSAAHCTRPPARTR